MSHYKQFLRTLRIAPGSDKIVLLACFLLTVFVDMVAGVGVGLIAASFLLTKRVMDLTSVEIEHHGNGEGLRRTLEHLPEGVLVYRIRGPLFFGTIEKAFDQANFDHERIHRFIVDMTDVPFIDMTGLVAFRSLITSVATAQRTVYIVGAAPEVKNKIMKKIAELPARHWVIYEDSLQAALDHQ